ncbi:transcriptional regulator GutM [Candidatus Enterococcus ferrettii]|uniref:Transcriptional regulator n=1 Tax=Candidatus Enterococcus ferrettii TaxID=2815324 RepID=A0ABV0EU86_9ENTE|nr:transcriptional regulator GutM [Enterococcus sp. 665A]MBO1339488.1 transcriptional regulator [Enterococcus sp. 665A]
MIYVIGAAVIGAYVLQTLLGMKQIKNFNQHYGILRRKGKVVIGVNKGRITAGTIVLFAINSQDEIIAAKKMQGTSVFADFRAFDQLIGYSLQELTEDHPALAKENKLTQKAVMQGQKNLQKFHSGTATTKAHQPVYSGVNLKILVSNQLFLYKKKFRKD